MIDTFDTYVPLVLTSLIVGSITALLVYALLKAGDPARPPQVILVVSLSLLTLVALAIGAAIASESAFAIAAAGVGALAGGVTSTFAKGQQQYEERQEKTDDVLPTEDDPKPE